MFSRSGTSFPALDIGGMYTCDDIIILYNGVFVVDNWFKCSDPLGNIGSQEEALFESFELPQYIVETPREDDPYPLVVSYKPSFFDNDQYMFICL